MLYIDTAYLKECLIYQAAVAPCRWHAAFSSSQNSTVACEMWSLSNPSPCRTSQWSSEISNFHRLNFQSQSAPSTDNFPEIISYIDLAQYVSETYQSQS